MPDYKLYFGITEDGELTAILEIPSEKWVEEYWFRNGQWVSHGSAGDVFRMNSISEEEAMRICHGVRPVFSR